MQSELIYQVMNGEIDLDDISLPEEIHVTDEFSDGRTCGMLYERVYNAKIRLNERLEKDEDSDVEEIISCMSSISKIMAMKMYQYGMLVYGITHNFTKGHV
ncbi:MAG: hypothetical protein J6C19_08345 [Lachnospiraceae bacterium]|nr:hypothetical protein [Lachnospiraceae bacterium]MBO5145526.1 hypothetical protein [Lachnospiraceae bacterium]